MMETLAEIPTFDRCKNQDIISGGTPEIVNADSKSN